MTTPPRWDLTPIFPGPDSEEFQAKVHDLQAGVTALATLAGSAPVQHAPGVDDGLVARFHEVVRHYEAMLGLGWSLESYVAALVDIDVDDDVAAAALAGLESPIGDLRLIAQGLGSWLWTIDIEGLIGRSPVAAERAHALRRLGERAVHAMPADAEALAAELHPVAGGAWGRLRARVVTDIRAEVEVDSVVERMPLSALRAMATDPDRIIRRRAYEAEVAAIKARAVTLTAALNGVVGERSVLARRRGWESPLDEALFDQGIDRATLGAMVAATRAALPDLRRHLDAKARGLGVERLAWFDLAVPVGDPRVWSFDEAAELVTTAFTRFSPALGGLAEDAFARRRVDAEPRSGKQGGGMCYWPANGRSLIRVEFHGGYDGVRMLAHELGHAYHFQVLHHEGRPLLQVESAPAPLMETASKLCEELVRREAIARARQLGDIRGEIGLLDGFLTGARRSIVDALTNFLFEERLFARRAARDLTADEINGLMDEVRADVNGDALDPAFPYPWTWAAQPHLYLDGRSFYNLPYLFGQLLALRMHAQLDESPSGFPERLDEFLADVGHRPTRELGRSIGFDLASTEFWADGLAVVGREIDRYEILVAGG